MKPKILLIRYFDWAIIGILAIILIFVVAAIAVFIIVSVVVPMMRMGRALGKR